MSKGNKGPDVLDQVSQIRKKRDERRKKHNEEVINKMKDGESLTNFDSMSSWFPPRPTIEKDKDLMGKLYASDAPKNADRSTLSQKDKKEAKGSKEEFASKAETQSNNGTAQKKPVKKDSTHLRQVE